MYKIFVANRISTIQELTASCSWLHVSGKINPADLLSRGTTVDHLHNSHLWWHGPTFLQNQQAWPYTDAPVVDPPEKRIVSISACIAAQVSNNCFPINSCSSLPRLCRITAYCLRFINNSKKKKNEVHHRTKGPISVPELRVAMKLLIRQAQLNCFASEIRLLEQGKPLQTTSKLLALHPFLDNKILRDGGRLRNASIPYEQRHPAILTSKHPLTRLIVNYEHLRHLHGGAQSLLAAIRLKYWPLRGRDTVRKIIRDCVRCCCANPNRMAPLMGQLAAYRVTPARPFLYCGVDFCGPFYLRPTRRSKITIKSYVAVFICLATKATHLEMVCDLTTEAFINAFRRVVSSRGKILNIYRDNATNFVGAQNELVELRRLFAQEEHHRELRAVLDEDQTTWHFIPARSPHFGGIWERAVRSAKHHLRRVAGYAALLPDEMLTLLARIACLNSRPLSPLSEDPSDLFVLTPGHFLIGAPITAIPEPSVLNLQENRLSRWQRIQRLSEQFWKKWSVEYLCELQKRSKWSQDNDAHLSIGDMVIIRMENLPPLKWRLGRVTELHKGKDDIVRVATIRTVTGSSRFAVRQLCRLPVTSPEE